MLTISYKYKVYLQNDNHKKKLSRLISLCTEVYNHIINLKRRYYLLYGKDISLYTLHSHISKIKKRSYLHWNELSSGTIRDINERICNGYKRFLKKHVKRPPQFKNCNNYWSLTFKDSGWKLKNNEFIINKQHLKLRFFKSREIDGKIQTVTLKRDRCNSWWLIFVVRKEQNNLIQRPITGKIVGFDFGLKHYLTSSDGTKIDSPLFFKRSLKNIKCKSKSLSSKVKGSNNYKRTKEDLSRMHRKIKNQRSDFHWKLANTLVKQYDRIALENLDIESMKRKWGRKVSDFGFADFVRILTYCCIKYGVVFKQPDRFTPTSKTCSSCGYIFNSLSLSDREWICPKCGIKHDRDVNAAKNIQKVVASTFEGGNVRHLINAVPVDIKILPFKGRSMPS